MLIMNPGDRATILLKYEWVTERKTVKPDFNLCDRCGAKAPDSSIYACTDRVCGPAGSMDDVGEHIDLCGKCSREAIEMLIRHDHELAQKLVKFARKT